MKIDIRITLPYACGGITAELHEVDQAVYDGTVIEPCAPIFRWMIGKNFTEMVKWVESKRGKVETTLPCSNFHGVRGTNG